MDLMIHNKGSSRIRALNVRNHVMKGISAIRLYVCDTPSSSCINISAFMSDGELSSFLKPPLGNDRVNFNRSPFLCVLHERQKVFVFVLAWNSLPAADTHTLLFSLWHEGLLFLPSKTRTFLAFSAICSNLLPVNQSHWDFYRFPSVSIEIIDQDF